MITRGINQQRNIWKTFMQSQFWSWKRKNLKTGKMDKAFVQGALRPIELWEYVFPKEHLEEVLSCMRVLKEDGSINTDFVGAKAAMLPVLRKALGAKKLPKIIPVPETRVMNVEGFGPNIIGYKEDPVKEWKDVGYEQEML